AASPSCPDQHDGALRNVSMRRFPRNDVGLVDPVIGARIGLPFHIDDHGRSDQLAERDLVRGVPLLDEMYGSVEMGAAVLSGREVVGRVVPTARHALRRDHGEAEGLSRWPVNGGRIKWVREVNPLRVYQTLGEGWAVAGREQQERGSERQATHESSESGLGCN